MARGLTGTLTPEERKAFQDGTFRSVHSKVESFLRKPSERGKPIPLGAIITNGFAGKYRKNDKEPLEESRARLFKAFVKKYPHWAVNPGYVPLG